LSREDFARAYLAFARAVAAYPRVHLEDLRASPEEGLQSVLRHYELDLRDTESLLQRFGEFRNCTGNTMLDNESSRARRILPPRAAPGDGAAPFHPSLSEADRLLGYERR